MAIGRTQRCGHAADRRAESRCRIPKDPDEGGGSVNNGRADSIFRVGSRRRRRRTRERALSDQTHVRASFRFFLASEVDCQGDNGERWETTTTTTTSRDERRISFRGINAAIKDRECRVLAPLKRRLSRRPRCNLRRDYDVRLRNPVGATSGAGYGELPRVSRTPRHIDSATARSYRTPETAIIRIPIIELFPRVALI